MLAALATPAISEAQASSSRPTSAPATTQAASAPRGEHFSRARELYKHGPSQAQQMLDELDLELQLYPDNMEAYLLKAMVQLGTNAEKDALKTLDQAQNLDEKAHAIHPQIHYLIARAYMQDGDYKAARSALDPYAAFFFEDPKAKVQYDQLMYEIDTALRRAEQEEARRAKAAAKRAASTQQHSK
jgi:tetratricopeptide (TPR) repeat protein